MIRIIDIDAGRFNKGILLAACHISQLAEGLMVRAFRSFPLSLVTVSSIAAADFHNVAEMARNKQGSCPKFRTY